MAMASHGPDPPPFNPTRPLQNTISDFWDIWGVIEQIVNSSVVELQSLSYHLSLLGNSTMVLVDQVAQSDGARSARFACVACPGR